MRKKWKKAFSIILAMIIVSIMLLVAYNLLEMIIPFSKNTKSIENATNSYYQAYGWVEESINFIAKNSVWAGTTKVMPTTSTWFSYNLVSTWSRVPNIWWWNSEFNKDWNIIAPWKPVQLYFSWGTAISWTNTKLYFKVPNISTWTISLSWWISPIINRQISGSWLTLNSSWAINMIWTWKINNSTSSVTDFTLWGQLWLDLEWTWNTFSNFYTNKLWSCASQKCSLKLSIVNQLISSTNEKIPYLEYYISFSWSAPGSAIPVPEQYVDITSEWKSYWFKKSIKTKYRVDTTSEAFDFTVFQ